MIIHDSNLDITFWAEYLKGNWRKGITNLEYIMQAPQSAEAFILNRHGLQLIYGIEDRNSVQLREVIERHGWADLAIAMYFNQLFSWNYRNWSEIILNAAAMETIASNKVAIETMRDSDTAMRAVATSYIAVAAIVQENDAFSAIMDRSEAGAIFAEMDITVAGKMTAILIGKNPNDFDDMNSVISNTAALGAMVESEVAMRGVVASSTAMTAVAASSTAMAAVGANATARAAIVASSAATSALASSPLIDSVSGTVAGDTTIRQQRAGRVWIVSARSWDSSSSWPLRIHDLLETPATRDISNTNYIAVNRFASRIAISHPTNPAGTRAWGFRFIPC